MVYTWVSYTHFLQQTQIISLNNVTEHHGSSVFCGRYEQNIEIFR